MLPTDTFARRIAMPQDSPTEAYSNGAKLFHWVVVALVVIQFGVAWTMPGFHRGKTVVGLSAWHLSIGATILAVMLARLAWRLGHRPPPPPRALPPALRAMSRITHYLLYTLLVLIPLLGWTNASARGLHVALFGIVPLPALVPTGSPLGNALGDVHAIAAIILLVVIGLHVLGALYHAVILRDRTLQRMLWPAR
jgi:cytochrome b561